MRLAEALNKRKRLREEINNLETRAVSYATIQEGNEPLGSSQDLLAQIQAKTEELGELSKQIARTNTEHTLDVPGQPRISLADLIIDRDMLRLRARAMKAVASSVTGGMGRYSRNEVRTIPQIDPEQLLADADRVLNAARSLDAELQAQNWKVSV